MLYSAAEQKCKTARNKPIQKKCWHSTTMAGLDNIRIIDKEEYSQLPENEQWIRKVIEV